MSILDHKSVLISSILEVLAPQDGKRYIDATFGAGGYTKAILQQADCYIYGIDRDETVLKYTLNIERNFSFIKGEFQNLKKIAQDNDIDDMDGIVFDIGVSSMQLDIAERGFSFSKEAKLDMRMDTSQSFSAYDVVNDYTEEQLSDIIFKLGGEKKSRFIARAICDERQHAPIDSTLQLAGIISKAVRYYNDTIHPATRTFQALRIEVNGELIQLEKGIKAASDIVAMGGKILVVTFHSLEDKIVKDTFNDLCGKTASVNRYSLPTQPSAPVRFRNLIPKVIVPSLEEVKHNPRARSAKLRAIMRIA